MPAPTRRNGFTLIELSIVLVVIGLLVGGVLVGKELIRSAELISVVSDVNKFKMAITIFEDKYKYLPGDMPNASAIWPSCDTPASNCNGNGDWHIDSWNPTFENYRAWQQLGDDGLIAGRYTGQYGPPSGRTIIGQNVPASKIAGGGYLLFYDAGGESFHYNRIVFAGNNSTGDFEQGLLTPAEAQMIEEKLGDDKIAGTGKIRGFERTGCVDWTTPTTYQVTNKNKACVLFFSLE